MKPHTFELLRPPTDDAPGRLKIDGRPYLIGPTPIATDLGIAHAWRFVAQDTGAVYTVTEASDGRRACECGDWLWRGQQADPPRPCKHMLALAEILSATT